jgi:hypothetical protein
MSSALAKFNADKGGSTGDNNSLTRTGIQHSIGPAVAAKLSGLLGYDPMGNVAHARRTLRALMTIAIQPLLFMGAPKEFMREQLLEALDNALRDHAEKFKSKPISTSSAKPLPAPVKLAVWGKK